MTMQEMKFSVIMSIYQNDVPEHLHIALESLLNQTRRPDEIVIVGDGPVPAELEQEIESLPTEGSGAAGSKFKVQGSNALKRVQDSKLHTDLTELTDFVSPVVKVLRTLNLCHLCYLCELLTQIGRNGQKLFINTFFGNFG